MKTKHIILKTYTLVFVMLLCTSQAFAELKITSDSFTDGGTIPVRCSSDGGNKSPHLSFGALLEGTVKLAVKMADLTGFDTNWVTEGGTVSSIPEGAQKLSDGASYSYHGPKSGENHEYEITVFAKDNTGKIIDSGTITGWYPDKPQTEAASENTSSGCSTGASIFSLIMLLPLLFTINKLKTRSI